MECLHFDSSHRILFLLITKISKHMPDRGIIWFNNVFVLYIRIRVKVINFCEASLFRYKNHFSPEYSGTNSPKWCPSSMSFLKCISSYIFAWLQLHVEGKGSVRSTLTILTNSLSRFSSYDRMVVCIFVLFIWCSNHLCKQ